MIIGSWNIRGVCEPFKQRELRAWIHSQHISMVGVLETRVRAGHYPHLIDNIMASWQSVSNYSQHPNGRIWLLWDPTILDIQPKLIMDQVIHSDVVILQKQIKLSVTLIYGLNCYIQRRRLWSSLCSLSRDLGSTPWLLLGDFNVVRFQSEMLGGNQQAWPPYMNELNECCNSSSLEIGRAHV